MWSTIISQQIVRAVDQRAAYLPLSLYLAAGVYTGSSYTAAECSWNHKRARLGGRSLAQGQPGCASSLAWSSSPHSLSTQCLNNGCTLGGSRSYTAARTNGHPPNTELPDGMADS